MKKIVREQAIEILSKASKEMLEAAAVLTETQEVEGDYAFNGEESYWEESGQQTLSSLASEFRQLANKKLLQ